MRDKYFKVDDFGERVPAIDLKLEEYLLGLDEGPDSTMCCTFITPWRPYKPPKKLKRSDLVFFKSLKDFYNPGQMLKRMQHQGKV